MQHDSKQELAKIAMVTSLGLTVATSLKMKGINKKIHFASGMAFCGFALWHHFLYQTQPELVTSKKNQKHKESKKSTQHEKN